MKSSCPKCVIPKKTPRSSFMVKRKDGLTDNIYEFDFKTGKFVGGSKTYSYSDIEEFLSLPSAILSELFATKKQAVKEEAVAE